MVARSFTIAAFLAWLSPAVLATDGTTCYEAEQHEEQSLLAVQARRFGPLPPPKEWCYKFSATFNSVTDEGGRITNILLRYFFVDVETATVPKLDGLGVVDENFALVFNGYNGDPQVKGYSTDQYYLLFEAQNLTEANLEEKPYWAVTGLWPNAAFVTLQLQYTFPDGTTAEVFQDLLQSDVIPSLPRLDEIPSPPRLDIRQQVFLPDIFNTTKFTEHLVVDGVKNPFVAGNPTVLTWKGQAKCAVESGRKVPGKNSAAAIASVSNKKSTVDCMDMNGTQLGNANVYRLPADFTAALRLPADKEGCSINYIFSPGIAAGKSVGQPDLPVYDFKYGYIRFRIPSFQNNFEETVQRGIASEANKLGHDLGYFSVSSQYAGKSPELPWSVHSLMLAAQAAPTLDPTEGIILFAPAEEVKALHTEGDTAPPIVQIKARPTGGPATRDAYLMVAPDYLWLFRYMAPGQTPWFEGNPSQGECKQRLRDQLETPITCPEMDQFQPVITQVDVDSVEALAAIVR